MKYKRAPHLGRPRQDACRCPVSELRKCRPLSPRAERAEPWAAIFSSSLLWSSRSCTRPWLPSLASPNHAPSLPFCQYEQPLDATSNAMLLFTLNVQLPSCPMWLALLNNESDNEGALLALFLSISSSPFDFSVYQYINIQTVQQPPPPPSIKPNWLDKFDWFDSIFQKNNLIQLFFSLKNWLFGLVWLFVRISKGGLLVYGSVWYPMSAYYLLFILLTLYLSLSLSPFRLSSLWDLAGRNTISSHLFIDLVAQQHCLISSSFLSPSTIPHPRRWRRWRLFEAS